MDWLQFVGILILLFGLFGFLYRELKDWRRETREETENIREEVRQQVARSDRLYEMFIDLLQDGKKRKKTHS